MLSVASMSAGQESYYLELAKEDYYLDGGEPPGKWLGQGSYELGLTGTVGKKELSNLFQGKFADGKPGLVQAQKGKRRQPGWDLTFSAPKSVSIAWAVAEPDLQKKIQHAQTQAVKAGISYLQENATYTRRGSGGEVIEQCAPIIAAFQHSTSRALDPQLHTHSLWLNAGVREDGSTGTLRSRDLYRHKMAAGAIYRSELAYELRKIGFKIEPKGKAFEIVGVSDKLISHFSTRRNQMLEKMRDLGSYSAKFASLVALTTRESKTAVSHSELKPFWKQTAADFGLTPAKLAEISSHAHAEVAESKENRTIERQTKVSAAKLADAKGHFSQAQLLADVHTSLHGKGYTAQRITEQTNHASKELHTLVEKPGQRLLTTKAHMALEARLLENSKSLFENHSHHVSTKNFDSATAKHKDLTPEQQTALEYVTKQSGDLCLIDGMPGAGKTYFLEAARKAWEAQGFKVVGAAHSRSAASNLEQKSGIKSHSIFGLRLRLEGGNAVLRGTSKDAFGPVARAKMRLGINVPRAKLTKRTVIVIDEATMLGTRDIESLVRQAKEHGAKIVLIGGTGQHSSIGAGGAFAALKERGGAVEINEIFRQKNEWERKAIEQFFEGDVKGALSQYVVHDKLFVLNDRDAAKNQVVTDWMSERSSDILENVVVAPTNKEVDSLNLKIQHARKQSGKGLGSRFITVDGKKLFVGDVIEIKENANVRGTQLYNHDVGVIKSIRSVGINRGEVQVTVALRRKEGRRLLDSPMARLLLGKERRVQAKFMLKDGVKFGLGYAVTDYAAEGGTYEKGFVLTGGDNTSFENFFVGQTRCTDSTKFYMGEQEAGDDLRELQRAVSHKRSKHLAHDAAKELDKMEKLQEAKRLQAQESPEEKRQRKLESKIIRKPLKPPPPPPPPRKHHSR